MRVLGVVQGSAIRVYRELMRELAKQVPVDSVAAFVSHSPSFLRMQQGSPLPDSWMLLREWEIVGEGRLAAPDWGLLERFERELGDPWLWNIPLADRRLWLGNACKRRQDYRPRFDHRQLAGILTTALPRIEAFFDEVRPTLVLGFGTATFGDLATHRFARARKIPYLLLKATKIWNYVSLNDHLEGLSRHIRERYSGAVEPSTEAFDLADEFMQEVRTRGLTYEGAIKLRKPSVGRLVRGVVGGAARDLQVLRDPVVRRDNHRESAVLKALNTSLLNPYRAARASRRLGRLIIRREHLPEVGAFAFFPLHFEPEVSIQVFGRSFQNQIEVVRNIARALPFRMPLLVKEHPRSLGFRPWQYYRKLLEIPNVRFVDPLLPAQIVVQHSSLVAVISGSIGLEAAVQGKPVITLGTPAYNVLPEPVLCHTSDLDALPGIVERLLGRRDPGTDAVRRYIAATIDGSTPINLYTEMLGKRGRERAAAGPDEEVSAQYRRLSRYLLQRMGQLENLD